MSKMDPVVHFEMPAEDKNRMAKFYTKAFGWKTEMLAWNDCTIFQTDYQTFQLTAFSDADDGSIGLG